LSAEDLDVRRWRLGRDGTGDVNVRDTGDVDVTDDGDLNVGDTGDVNVRDDGDVNVRDDGDVNGAGGVTIFGGDLTRRAMVSSGSGTARFDRREEESWSEWLRSPQALHRRHSGTVAAVVQRRLGEGCAVGGCAVSSVFV